MDVSTLEEAKRLVEELSPYVGIFKIGKELFTSEGPTAIKAVREAGGEVFLDLKFHDIPRTVEGACRAATKHDVYMLNVHASGGKEMMEAAKRGAIEGSKAYGTKTPLIVAVTVLTSIDTQILNEELGVPGRIEDVVLRYARLAEDAGLDGVVCSAKDLEYIRPKLKRDFIYVTPGIKSPTGVVGYDQKRVYTPGKAIWQGSTILVVGSAIRKVLDETTGKMRDATYEEMKENAKMVLEDMAKYL
ncbi:MAG: orotidine-5'-phosphate decarboxylase [Candidatus Aenigmarchaeota archaeon]|nr:orotidine-5'-phosphate decarboxylase [Candidatus Aenigmarchaeota archaeon]